MQHHKAFVKDPSSYIQKLKALSGWEKRQWGAGRTLPRLVYQPNSSSDQIYAIIGSLVSKIETMSNSKVEGIWGNWYRNGNDYCPDHKDNYGTDIYCISFGGTRRVRFRNDKTNKLMYITVKSGDCYHFTSEFDSKHTHSVPKTKDKSYCDKDRFSIVFFTTPKAKPSLALCQGQCMDLISLYPDLIPQFIAVPSGDSVPSGARAGAGAGASAPRPTKKIVIKNKPKEKLKLVRTKFKLEKPHDEQNK